MCACQRIGSTTSDHLGGYSQGTEATVEDNRVQDTPQEDRIERWGPPGITRWSINATVYDRRSVSCANWVSRGNKVAGVGVNNTGDRGAAGRRPSRVLGEVGSRHLFSS